MRKRQPWGELGLKDCKQKECHAWHEQHPWGRKQLVDTVNGLRGEQWETNQQGEKASCWRCGEVSKDSLMSLGFVLSKAPSNNCQLSVLPITSFPSALTVRICHLLQPLQWPYAPRTREQVSRGQDIYLIVNGSLRDLQGWTSSACAHRLLLY